MGRCVTILGLLLCALTLSAQAQTPGKDEWKYRWEVFGSLGKGWLYHGDSHEFDGLNLAFGFGIRPFKGALSGLGFEGRFGNLDSNDVSGDLYSDIKLLSGSAVYHFGRSKVQPYLFGGVVWVRGSRDVRVLYYESDDTYYEERYKEAIRKLGIEIGGGVKIALKDWLSIRPEVRLPDTTPGAGFNLAVPQLSIGVGFHW